MGQQYAVMIGAGPAGLTAAPELIRTTGIRPIVLAVSQQVGGNARTVSHSGSVNVEDAYHAEKNAA